MMIFVCWYYLIYYFIFKKQRIKDIKDNLLTSEITFEYHCIFHNKTFRDNEFTIVQSICFFIEEMKEKRDRVLSHTTNYDEKMVVLSYYFYKQIKNKSYTGWFLGNWVNSNNVMKSINKTYCGYYKEKYYWKHKILK